MGQRVSSGTEILAPPQAVYDVIADLPAYPQWAPDVVRTEVLEATDEGLPLVVAFKVDARIAMVHYTIRYEHRYPEAVRWTLVDGELLSQLDGEYVLTPTADGTHVQYTLEVGLAMPLPSFIQRRGAKVVLETGLYGLKRRVEGD